MSPAPRAFAPPIPQARPATPGPYPVLPTDRGVPPTVTGSHLGLQPGETATERSLRLMNIIAELEQLNADLREENDKLKAELKEKEAKLQAATFQMNAARKELSQASDEFKRLRKELSDLRDKIRTAEQENTSLLRSLAPLLQQMLQTDVNSTSQSE